MQHVGALQRDGDSRLSDAQEAEQVGTETAACQILTTWADAKGHLVTTAITTSGCLVCVSLLH